MISHAKTKRSRANQCRLLYTACQSTLWCLVSRSNSCLGQPPVIYSKNSRNIDNFTKNDFLEGIQKSPVTLWNSISRYQSFSYYQLFSYVRWWAASNNQIAISKLSPSGSYLPRSGLAKPFSGLLSLTYYSTCASVIDLSFMSVLKRVILLQHIAMVIIICCDHSKLDSVPPSFSTL